jgi:hypothetical protein
MKPQKLSNLEQRLARWERERADWLYKKVPSILFIGVIVSCVLMYALSLFYPQLKSYWFFLGGIFTLGLAIVPITIGKPKKPSQEDVNVDIALRKAFKMDASVSEDK